MNPLCSIIIPAFNAAQYVAEAIESVLSQQCDFDFEIIVVDDGSRDDTAQVVRKYSDGVHLLRQENSGPGSARNHGAAHARTDILVFLDADDRMLPGRLARQAGFMLAHPEVSLTFGNRVLEDSPDKDPNSGWNLPYTDCFDVIPQSYQKLLIEGDYVQTTASAVRRSVYLECGGMAEDVRVGEDYAVWCAIALEYSIAYTSHKLTWYRQENHGNLMSSPHTYYGPVRVLYENLKDHRDMLTRQEYSRALSRFYRLARALIRYEWAVNGRRAAMARLDEFAELLPPRFRFFWQTVSMCPPPVGRSLRRVRHCLKRQTDQRWETCTK